MIARIHIHPKVEKRLEQLKKKSNAPLIAAKRADKIIQALGKGIRPVQAGHLSKSKEARVKNLYKFNLGSGYRLICIKKKHNIYVLFIGSHDNCDTWLDKHRKKKLHKTELSMNVYDIKTSGTPPMSELSNTLNKIEHDCFLLPEVSQQDLRKIFRGLIDNR